MTRIFWLLRCCIVRILRRSLGFRLRILWVSRTGCISFIRWGRNWKSDDVFTSLYYFCYQLYCINHLAYSTFINTCLLQVLLYYLYCIYKLQNIVLNKSQCNKSIIKSDLNNKNNINLGNC